MDDEREDALEDGELAPETVEVVVDRREVVFPELADAEHVRVPDCDARVSSGLPRRGVRGGFRDRRRRRTFFADVFDETADKVAIYMFDRIEPEPRCPPRTFMISHACFRAG